MGAEEDRMNGELNNLVKLKQKKLELILAESKILENSLQREIESDYQQIIGRRQSLMDEIDALDNRFLILCRNLEPSRQIVLQSIVTGAFSLDALPGWSWETAELIQEQRRILREIMQIDQLIQVTAGEMMQEIRNHLKGLKMNRSIIKGYVQSQNTDEMGTDRVLDKKE